MKTIKELFETKETQIKTKYELHDERDEDEIMLDFFNSFPDCSKVSRAEPGFDTLLLGHPDYYYHIRLTMVPVGPSDSWDIKIERI